MAWVLYRTADRTVETFSETPFFRIPNGLSQREVTPLPDGIRRGSVYNAGFTAITNPSTTLTLTQELQQAFEGYWEQCRIWTASLLSYADSDLTIPRRGIQFIDRSKMCFFNRYNTIQMQPEGAFRTTQSTNLAIGLRLARLGALDVTSPQVFASLVNSFPDPTGNPRLWIAALGNGPVTRTTLANGQEYGSFIANFDSRERFWI